MKRTLRRAAALALLVALMAAPAGAVTGESIPTAQARLDGYAHISAQGLAEAVAAAGAPRSCDIRPEFVPAADLLAARVLAPGTDVFCVTAWEGRLLDTSARELDLSGAPVANSDALAELLGCFPCLEKVDMCGCGLSDEEMAALGERLPGVRLVWEVAFGKWRLRTDARVFSTLHHTQYYTSEDFAPLRYCTDLRALDLGHNRIDDLSFLEPLTELRILILADNSLADISALAGLTKLEYLELFMNSIEDVEPLSGLERLMDLNICHNPVSDPAPLASLPSLERLWISHTGVPAGALEALRASLPGCRCNTTTFYSTDEGWRVHQRYYVIFRIFNFGEYLPWDADVPRR